ncbi:MAG TPA: hypothetical protein VIY90_05320 [Steroidobacteraceae bacterium]
MTAAWLVGVRILSLSTVAIQTAYASRLVAAAGTVANLVVGALIIGLLNRTSMRTNFTYFLWLFAGFNLSNSGYLVASALMGTGDWSVVIRNLSPAWAWRCALGIVGATVYVGSVHWLARSMARLVETKVMALRDLRRFVIAGYLAGGAVLTIASIFNPISPRLILISGIGASFGLSVGLLFVPGIIKRQFTVDSEDALVPTSLSVAWVCSAMIVGIIFIAVFGPGVHFGS